MELMSYKPGDRRFDSVSVEIGTSQIVPKNLDVISLQP